MKFLGGVESILHNFDPMSFSAETKNLLLCNVYANDCCTAAQLTGMEAGKLEIPTSMPCSDCISAFLSGVFISYGTMSHPDKDYRLELLLPNEKTAISVTSYMDKLGFSPKKTMRGKSHVLYLGDSTMVEDFLVVLGAPQASMKVMDAKILREIRNTQNRHANCDAANIFKSTEAAQKQIQAISALAQSGKLEELPEELRTTANLRQLYPDASLAELAGLHTPPITKSGLNHRLKKIVNWENNNQGTAK